MKIKKSLIFLTIILAGICLFIFSNKVNAATISGDGKYSLVLTANEDEGCFDGEYVKLVRFNIEEGETTVKLSELTKGIVPFNGKTEFSHWEMAENTKASEELETVETEMNNAITKVEELGIRKDEALSNQAKLNEYFELALEGNINITRDAITSLLEKFDFNEDEQREAAKILMFPEDALYEYDASFKSGSQTSGKTITEVLMEAKKESKSEVKEEPKEETILDSEEPSSLENIFESVISENAIPDVEEPEEEHEEKEEPKEDAASAVKPLFSDNNEESVTQSKVEEDSNNAITSFLENLGLDLNSINKEKLDKVINSDDEETINKNIEVLKSHEIDLDILIENIELLLDKELAEKIDKLIAIGKESRDISLMPSVLVKYDLNGLNNTINLLQISGLDPKKVPLMAY